MTPSGRHYSASAIASMLGKDRYDDGRASRERRRGGLKRERAMPAKPKKTERELQAMIMLLGAMPGHAHTPAAPAISSGGYQNAPVLRNPTNDASYIAAFSVRRIILGAVEDMRDIGSLGSSLHRMPPGSGHDMTRSPRRSSWLTASLPLRAGKIELSRGAKWSSLGSGLVKRPQALCHNETDRIVVADSQCITKGPKALPTAPWGEASR